MSVAGSGPLLSGLLAGLALLAFAPGRVAATRVDRVRPVSRDQVVRSRSARARSAGHAVARWLPTSWPRPARSGLDATSAAVIELLDGLAAELMAGRPPAAALRRVGADVDDDVLRSGLAPVLVAASSGADIAAALSVASELPGCFALRWLASAVRVAEATGASLALVVDRVASSARAEADHRREVASSLAAPRATARLLAVLPVVGLLMGEALGAHPVGVLLGTPPGLGCLAAGLALELAGLRWTARMAAVAERS